MLSAASEPPDFSADEAEDVMNNRGSISRKMTREMFTGERPSRSPSRSRSPGKRPQRTEAPSPPRSHGQQTMDGDHQEDFEIGCENDNER